LGHKKKRHACENRGRPSYSEEQRAALKRYEGELRERMEFSKPKRLAHSLSVADCAERLALAYDVDPFEARVAGILHDWDKVYPMRVEVARAREQGIDLGVDLELVAPLLHGMTAATGLRRRFPELSETVLTAVSRHTMAARNMTPLDMVVFVADGIEPLRPNTDGIAAVRKLVDEGAALEDVFWSSFSGGLEYVIRTGRYLYPGTVDIYNDMALARQASK